MRTHTKEKPYQCEECKKEFSRISSLREHERTIHGIENSARKSKPKEPNHKKHKPGCGHVAVMHNGHTDILVEGVLHHIHSKCKYNLLN